MINKHRQEREGKDTYYYMLGIKLQITNGPTNVIGLLNFMKALLVILTLYTSSVNVV